MTDTRELVAPPATVVWERVLSIREELTALADTDLGVLDVADVEDLLVAVEEITRMVPVVLQQPLVRQVAERGIATDRGCRSVASYLQQLLRLRRGEANTRLAAVEWFQPRTTLTGEVLPARYPAVAAAMAVGEISPEYGRVIASSLDRLPTAVGEQARETTEAHLVDCARAWDPVTLSRRATRLEAVLDPDGLLVTEAEQVRRRELSIRKTTHGMWRLTGLLDSEAANIVQTAVEPLAQPRPGPDGERDPRSAGCRRADALVQLAQWGLGHPEMPAHGGVRPQLVATVTLAELEQRVGVARLNNGDPITVPRLLQRAGEVDAVLAVFGHHGEVLHYGRSQRTAPAALRRALQARDRGCAFDGCDAAPLWTEAHHVKYWSAGGTTDIDNTALHCKPHHRLIHHSDWRTVIIHGMPHTIPPAWIDPRQRPRRNQTHHPP